MKPGKGWKRGYKFCVWDCDERTFASAIGGLATSGGVRYGLGEITRPRPGCGPLAVFAHFRDAVWFVTHHAGILCSCWYKPYSGLATQPERFRAPRTRPRLWAPSSLDSGILDITTDDNELPQGTRFADEVRLEKIVSLIRLERACQGTALLQSFYMYAGALSCLSQTQEPVARMLARALENPLKLFGGRDLRWSWAFDAGPEPEPEPKPEEGLQ